MSRPLRSNLDICRFYYERYEYWSAQGNLKQAHSCMIRLMQLLKKEWGIYDEEN